MKHTKKEKTEERVKTTKIVKCNCSHEYQDLVYGVGKRAANLIAKEKPTDGTRVYRCTVCSKLHKV